MRKFLDFVVRDDRPVITPPSENEAEFFDDINGHHEDGNIETHTQQDGRNLIDIPAGVELVPEKVPSQTSHPSDGQEKLDDASILTVNEIPKEHTELLPPVPTPISLLASQLPDTAAADAKIDDEAKERSHRAVDEAEHGTGQADIKSGDIQATASLASESYKSRSAVRELFSRSDDRLRKASAILEAFASGAALEEQKKSVHSQPVEIRDVVSALREIAETMVWADQHEPSLWDTFMECAVMRLLLRCLQATIRSKTGLPSSPGRKPGNVVPNQIDGAISTLHIQSDAETSENRLTPDIADENMPNLGHGKDEAGQGIRGRVSHVSTERNLENDRQGAPIEHSVGDFTRQTFYAFAPEIQSQVLQSLSIMIQSIFEQRSLLCLFSSNHINEILSFHFGFEDDEMLGYFMSAVKTIALKLDPHLLQLFFDSSRGSFPLYTNVIRFFNHREQMVRIAVRNVTLTIYDLGDPDVLTFSARDESMYLHKTVDLLAKLCGSVSRGIELLMDDGSEVRRTRSRTGVFRRKVRQSDITAKLEEIENLFAYFGDVASISDGALHPLVLRLVSSKLFTPFFRPLASRASPKAIQAQKRWHISKTAAAHQTSALSVFDAGARCLLLACVLRICRSSCLGNELIRELSSRTPQFEDRTVLHGLKAMASDMAGTERISFVALCAIEAVLSCDATSKQILRGFGYDFDNNRFAESLRTSGYSQDSLLYGDGTGDVDNKERQEEPLLMTLSEFEAPLTTSNSLPSTPRYEPPSPSHGSTPPKNLSRVISMSALSTEGIAYIEGSDSDAVLLTFQFGEATLREVILSLILVVRRREIRTMRVLHAICRILTVSAASNDFDSSIDLANAILDEIASVMLSFLRDKRTTIVSIERMFENFRSVAGGNSSGHEALPNLEGILCPDIIPSTAAELPAGASKRRRVLHDDFSPPTETEDAAALFVIMHACESLVDEHLKQRDVDESNALRNTSPVLSSQVKDILSGCGLAESYLDKREALLEVARIILERKNVM